MKKILIVLFLLVMPLSALDTVKLKPIFDKHCVECHGPDKQKGKFRIDDITELDTKAWFDIYEQIKKGEMPPEDETPLEVNNETYVTESILDHLDSYKGKSKSAFRRLNKREYSNSVRDLLGLYDVYNPGERVSAEDISHGFDTEAKSLVISDYQLLQYMSSAMKSLSHAIKSHSPETPQGKVKNLKMSKLLPRGRDQGPTKDNAYITRSQRKITTADVAVVSVPGYYKIKFTASGVDRFFYKIPMKPVKDKFTVGLGVKALNDTSTTNKGILLKSFELEDNELKEFEQTIWINEGFYPYLKATNVHSKGVVQIRSAVRKKILFEKDLPKKLRTPGVKITSFSIEGPFYKEWPVPSYKQTFDTEGVLDITKEEVRKAMLDKFLSKAFRGFNTKDDLDRYIDFMNLEYAREKEWSSSIKNTMAAILSSIKFLYLSENDGELKALPLAGRLSYFFWSTTPDKELLSLAKSGKLKEESIYKEQVSRLLNDSRSDRFLNSFVTQWLKLDILGTMRPDSKDRNFRSYNTTIENSMREETQFYFKHIFKNNLSVKEFINSNYTFTNNALAAYYNLPYEGDGSFEKTSFPPGSSRGGILGHASILTLTSNGVETSPIVRGVWVLENFLGTPPPPPPEAVPAITPDTTGAVTVRQLLDQHRSNESCASCHKKMDPIGLALESFDPIGRTRKVYDDKNKVESNDVFKGEAFDDVNGLKKIFLKNSDSFARNLIIKIAEYGKGRKLNFKDYTTVEKLLKESAKNDHRFKDLFLSVVMSDLIKKR